MVTFFAGFTALLLVGAVIGLLGMAFAVMNDGLGWFGRFLAAVLFVFAVMFAAVLWKEFL